MSDIIKQIDEWQKNDNRAPQDLGFLLWDNVEEIKAALTVLQKIASGDDWFDISKLPEIGHLYLWIEYNDKSGTGYEREGFVSTVNGDSRLEINDHSSWDSMHKTAKKFKLQNPAKHIKMMMERELNK